MTDVTFDLDTVDAAEAPPPDVRDLFHVGLGAIDPLVGRPLQGQIYETGLDQRPLGSFWPRNNHRRQSADCMETDHFLRSCRLCMRRLVPGRDIYMYRGDGAFCSEECRQQQMNDDERKEKCSLASKKKDDSSFAVKPKPSAAGETVAAAM
ncbi:FCS-Like Zinc finger 6-like [Punica granatum]|uniref:FCS-Like Zinc finger 6-like n=1 Tax=Punica granatum TaxID=22663 RepID=A0A218Y123_PUNGR|nr:FCS-Like Zinc finger 6-like [Punica granatum]OWM90252.1 hypothetical protein CDL15_Pgr006573 [Punica granatum]